MTEQNESRTISRRKILAGLAATAGVGAAIGGAYGITELVKSTEKALSAPDLTSAYIGEPVPAADPGSGLWNRADAQKVQLVGQAVIPPLKPDPSVADIQVRSLHDGENIAFRIEWADPERSEHAIKIDQFRDSCGVFLGPHPASAGLWTMGMPDNPVTILHWRADWQKDIDDGFQDLEVAFPNVSFDFYPPLVGIVNPKIPDDYPEEARSRLPGWYSGNPLSQPGKTTPVEKLRAIGPGTLEHLATQNATGKGSWEGGKWRVVLSKPMKASDDEETTIEAGKTYSLAFTVWSGAVSDRGSRKQLTNLGQLQVQAAG